MEIIKIYLSGSMSGVSWEEQTKWRNAIINEIKYGSYHIEKDVKFFNPTDFYNFEEIRHKSEKEVMNFDLNALRKSDLVIVNYNDPKSIGTAIEIALAKEYNIPVVGLNKDKIELHPWLTELTDRMCDSMRELADYVAEFYLQ